MHNSNTGSATTGSVLLVGAGCENGQITRRALQAIREADVIVHDDLMDKTLLTEAPQGCELVEVGKRWKSHKKEQEEINEILIESARQGLKVVRLKGGDPTVFGRGGEEFLALQEAGIRCELIPGVSSCIAAPQHMGISVTQRGMASSFTVVTGHSAPETAESYEALAALRGTLIFLMGLRKAGEISEGLIRAGKDPETPASILSCVFTPMEKRVDGTLRTLPQIAEEVEAPAILVIGATAALHLRNDEGLALVVGTKSFTGKMAALLRKDGLRTVEYPCVGVVPQPEEIPSGEEMAQYDWMVFTSANGVRVFAEEMHRRKADLRGLAHMKFACIGPGTANALEEKLFLRADLMPGEYTSEVFAEVLGKAVKPGQKVLILRAAEGNPVLTVCLEREKIAFRDCPIYHSQYFGANDSLPADEFDYVVFGSAGGVRAFLKENALSDRTTPVCIGRNTERELEALTGRRGVIAGECTAEGIRRALREA